MGFMRFKNTGFNSAVTLPAGAWRGMFLRGERLAQTTGTALEYEAAIGGSGVHSGKLNAIPEPFKSACDGMLMLPITGGCWQTIFFKGDQACWYHWDTKVVSNGPWTALARGGPTWNTMLPAAYKSDVDALLMDSVEESAAWRTYVFKGDRVATIDWATGCTRDVKIVEGAQPTAGWAKLAPGWQSDFDHVLPLPSVAGAKRSLFVKGANGCVFNWNTGPEKTGSLTTVLPELAALPAPYTTQYRAVSGRYLARDWWGHYDVRVDLDGTNPARMISADCWLIEGATTNYFQSFKATPAVTVSATELVATFTPQWSGIVNVTGCRVVIPRVAASAAAPIGRLELTYDDGWVGIHDLTFESPYFRTVDLETDAMAGKPAFVSYDTAQAAVPAGYTNRVLTVASAFADVGIEMRASGTVNTVGAGDSGADLRWSQSELHTAMQANFSGYADARQWKIWAFVANKHTDGTTTGIMFDMQGKMRQGMAVFYDSINTTWNLGRRHEAGLYVHEFGHVFNLVHSWEKAGVGAVGGVADLSWMNYPDRYNGPAGVGHDAYYQAFRFAFTDSEVRHLRHAYYDAIVPGGANMNAVGSAAYQAAPSILAAFEQPVADDSGLTLTLSARPFVYGEPVTVETRLASADGREVTVHRNLSPTGENISFAITSPAGTTRVFRPLARLCSAHDESSLTVLNADRPALYESAFLGSGADGQYFLDPGLYRVRAVYQAPDGSRIVSNDLQVRIRLPLTGDDQDAGELLMGDEAGTLMALLGSDSPTLQAGNDALSELSERFAGHPLAVYSHLAQGANAGRDYQHIVDGQIEVRPPDTKDSTTQLTAAIDASTGPEGLNNITLNAAMRRLATVHAKAGDLAEADTVLVRLVDHFRDDVPTPVLETIQAQADATRETILPTDVPRP